MNINGMCLGLYIVVARQEKIKINNYFWQARLFQPLSLRISRMPIGSWMDEKERGNWWFLFD